MEHTLHSALLPSKMACMQSGQQQRSAAAACSGVADSLVDKM
jgi:hypothetical protein